MRDGGDKFILGEPGVVSVSATTQHLQSIERTQSGSRFERWLASFYQLFKTDKAVAYALTIFLTHRLLLSALGAALALFAPLEPPLGNSLLRDIEPQFWGPNFFLLGPWQRWDTNWYINIAAWGYNIGNGSTHYPPLYPLSIGILGRLLLGQYMLAALIISNLAYIVALIYLYKLTHKLFDENVARRTLLCMAVFPSAFFLASGYTESLFLAFAVAAFYYGEQRRWYLAAGLVALASITRLQGAVLVIPLGLMFMQQLKWHWRRIGWRGFALLASPGLLLSYVGYVYFILGDLNFNNHLAVIWRVEFAAPWETLFKGLTGLLNPVNAHNLVYNLLDFVLLVLFMALALIWWQRRLPWPYLVYCLVSLLVYLTRSGTGDFLLMSINRYLVLLFPAFMLLAQLAPRQAIKISAGVQAIWAALFIMWMWAG